MRYSFGSKIASAFMLIIILSSLLVFALKPWIVLIVNGVGIIIFLTVFGKYRIPNVIIVVACIILAIFGVMFIFVGEKISNGIAKYFTNHEFSKELLASFLHTHKIYMIIGNIVVGISIGIEIFVTIHYSDEIRNHNESNNISTAVLSAMGGVIVMLSILSNYFSTYNPNNFENDIGGYFTSGFLVLLYSVLPWLYRIWWNCDSDDSGSKTKEYDIYIVEHDE